MQANRKMSVGDSLSPHSCFYFTCHFLKAADKESSAWAMERRKTAIGWSNLVKREGPSGPKQIKHCHSWKADWLQRSSSWGSFPYSPSNSSFHFELSLLSSCTSVFFLTVFFMEKTLKIGYSLDHMHYSWSPPSSVFFPWQPFCD